MSYRFFIDRPVFATVVSLLVVLIGLVSYLQLSVREYPNIDEPVVSVRTSYPLRARSWLPRSTSMC